MSNRDERAQEKRTKQWSGGWLEALTKASRATLSTILGPAKYKKLVALTRDGIPSAIRGAAWKSLIGNKLALSQSLFEIYKQQAQRMVAGLHVPDVEARGVPAFCTTDDGGRLGKYHTFSMIDNDISRTFDELTFFAKAPMWRAQLQHILRCFVLYRCVRSCTYNVIR